MKLLGVLLSAQTFFLFDRSLYGNFDEELPQSRGTQVLHRWMGVPYGA